MKDRGSWMLGYRVILTLTGMLSFVGMFTPIGGSAAICLILSIGFMALIDTAERAVETMSDAAAERAAATAKDRYAIPEKLGAKGAER